MTDSETRINWPTREQWAERERTVYYDYLVDLPASKKIADYANPYEVQEAIAALREIWCHYGRCMKGSKDTDRQRYRNFQYRREIINEVIRNLRDGRYHYSFDRVLEHDSRSILVTIKSRYEAARDAEIEGVRRRVEATPIDDAAWEQELERRRAIERRRAANLKL